MKEKIVFSSIVFLCGLLFVFIGVYADRRREPMWFWAGTEVESEKITDVQRYNHENAIMWKKYSLWFISSAIAEIFSPILALILLILSCTAGIWILLFTYNRILNKYSRK